MHGCIPVERAREGMVLLTGERGRPLGIVRYGQGALPWVSDDRQRKAHMARPAIRDAQALFQT